MKQENTKIKLIISKTQLQQISRYELTLREIVQEERPDIDDYDIECPEIYTFTLDDLTIAIQNLRKADPTIDDFGSYWLCLVSECWEGLDMDRACGYLDDWDDTPEYLKDYKRLDLSDTSWFDTIWRILDDAWEDCYEDISDRPLSEFLDLADLLADLDRYKTNRGKSIEEWDFQDWEKENYIRPFEEDSYVKQASEKALALARTFLEDLCRKDNDMALRIKGYACYGGSRLYPCSWQASRDCILRLFEKTDDPVYANTLGYIYYYGRCTGGVPEYKKAFHYFEIAGLNGLYEGMYKLADMYANGYACPKSPRTAFAIYSQVYYENLRRFTNGDDAVFADAALRMGNASRSGIGTAKNLVRAYEYYLQADYAARLRARHDDFFGNTTVVMNAKKALEETERELPADYFREYLDLAVPAVFENLTEENNRCTLSRRQLENGDVELTAERYKTKKRSKPARLLVTLSSLRYCERTGKFTYIAVRPEKIYFRDHAQKIRYDYCSWNYDEDRCEFYYDDELTAWIKAESYRVYAPETTAPTGVKYTMASITFTPGGRSYDYICEIPGIKEGDTVVVNGYDGETEVDVVAVRDKYETELGLPVERFKKVVRKVEN